MPIELTNISSDTDQRHVILFQDSEIELRLRYYPTRQFWAFDVAYKGVVASGYKLSVGVLHMRSRNLPFDFVVQDNSGEGLDPLRADDFTTGRCTLLLLDAADMELIRAAPVPI